MKYLKLTLILSIFILAFSGCNDKTATSPQTNEQQSQVDTQKEEVLINKQPITDKIAGFTEVTSYVGDCDGDGIDETVVLSTAAERNSRGEFLWNDGQDWALYIKDKDGSAYTLYDGFVQAGNIYFDVADYYMSEGAKPVITVTVSTGAGLCIKNYSYSAKDNGYIETIVYDTQHKTAGGINRRFTSIPEILK